MARLPAFIALRALEAAARHWSYSRAAEELHVTHAAVSHQIRRLEEELGVELFRRRGNAMEPTETARLLAGRIGKAVGILQSAVDEAAAHAAKGPMVVSAEPGFVRLWLAPRLGHLQAATGEHDLELRLEDRKVDLEREDVDAVVRHGPGEWPGLESQVLFRERLFPVCSREFMQTHRLEQPSDLLRAPLLRHTIWQWRPWFLSLGLEPPTEQAGMLFDDTTFMIDAAARGLGAALGRSSLVGDELKSGRLVRPFSEEIAGDWGYFFVWRPSGPRLGRILKLRDWLAKAAAEAQS